MRLTEQRIVSRAHAEVFDYTADFSNIEHWDPGIVGSRKITAGPVALGTRFELDVKLGSSIDSMIYEVTEFDPPDRVVLVGTGAKLDAVDEIRFSSRNGSTVIDYVADLAFKGPLRFVTPFTRGAVRRVGTKALDGLAAALA